MIYFSKTYTDDVKMSNLKKTLFLFVLYLIIITYASKNQFDTSQ